MMRHYELEISQFADNELSADKQKELFAHLSGCNECRQILSDFIGIKKDSKLFYNELELELKPFRFLQEIQNKKENNIYKALFYFSVAASIILGILFLMRYSGSALTERQYHVLEKKYNKLTLEQHSLEEEMAVIKANANTKTHYQINASNKKAKRLKIKRTELNSFSQSLVENDIKHPLKQQEIRIVQVTKNDFLTPQIIGN